MKRLKIDERGLAEAKANRPAPRPSEEVNSWPSHGPAIGVLTGFSPDGMPIVEWTMDSRTMQVNARSAVRLDRGHIGRPAVLLFEEDRLDCPIVVGVLESPRAFEPAETCPVHSPDARQVTLEVDGERVVVSARDELVLRCGAASITLTKAGKILLRGHYVSSSATGVNRIKGGSIELN